MLPQPIPGFALPLHVELSRCFAEHRHVKASEHKSALPWVTIGGQVIRPDFLKMHGRRLLQSIHARGRRFYENGGRRLGINDGGPFFAQGFDVAIFMMGRFFYRRSHDVRVFIYHNLLPRVTKGDVDSISSARMF